MKILLGPENSIYVKHREALCLLTELCQIERDQTPGYDYMVGMKELQQGKR